MVAAVAAVVAVVAVVQRDFWLKIYKNLKRSISKELLQLLYCSWHLPQDILAFCHLFNKHLIKKNKWHSYDISKFTFKLRLLPNFFLFRALNAQCILINLNLEILDQFEKKRKPILFSFFFLIFIQPCSKYI